MRKKLSNDLSVKKRPNGRKTTWGPRGTNEAKTFCFPTECFSLKAVVKWASSKINEENCGSQKTISLESYVRLSSEENMRERATSMNPWQQECHVIWTRSMIPLSKSSKFSKIHSLCMNFFDPDGSHVK